jgi:hypothetical protein
MSLDEGDLSDESTTEVSSEHSDWGSDAGEDHIKSPTVKPPDKKRSPKNKKRRRAAQKCRELVTILFRRFGNIFEKKTSLREHWRFEGLYYRRLCRKKNTLNWVSRKSSVFRREKNCP